MRKKAVFFVMSLFTLLFLYSSVVFAQMGPAKITGNRDFKWPVVGYSDITSCYFNYDYKTHADQGGHYALDIWAPTGTTVVAAYGGTVIESRVSSSWGNTILIQHSGYKGATLYTRYSHMNTRIVNVGDSVNKGQKIGTVGKTGQVSGEHLDFCVMKDSYANPWRNYAIDPFACQLLELPSGLYSAGSGCCNTYVTEVKNLYSGRNPFGNLDGYSGGNGTISISGWVADWDDPGAALQVHVYVGGPAGSGVPGYAITANKYRSDVNDVFPGIGNYHGFEDTIAVSPRGNQKLYIYGLNVGGGENILLATADVTINEPVYRYSLDVNGMLDGREDGGLGDYGTCDVYINGELKADDCNDFYSANGTWEQGSTYEIRDIKATKCHKYEGVHSGSLSGTLNANTSVFLKFVTAHDYQKQEIKATCVNPAGAKYTCKNCGDTYTEYAAADWSDWSETYPQGVDQKLVESRTEYSYSDKQTTTSESSSLSGWTQTGSEPVYSDWGGWSAWQTEPVTSGETVDVASEKVYRYYYFYCPVCGGREPFQGLSDCGQYTLTLSDAHTGWFTLPYSQSNPQSYNYTTAKVYTTAPDGNRWNFSKSNLNDTALGTLDAGNGAVVITTGYRSRTRSRTGTKYYYEKWGDWSDWTATAVTESSARQVKTRTVYRYNRTPYGNHSYGEGTISNNTVTYKCVKCDNIKKVPLITVNDNSGTLVVKLAATNKITAQGIVYGKGNNVTLETPGRTRIAYSKVDSNRRYTFDTAKLTGCTIRAYVVYTDKNGKEQVVYSSSYTR